jgi:predicted MFS family arabinose efflux permease
MPFMQQSFVSLYGLLLFVAFYGLDWFATVPPTVRVTIRLFGREKPPIMFGWLMCAHQIGGASAAFFAGMLRMELGTYLQAFILSGLMCLAATVIVLLINAEPEPPSESPCRRPHDARKSHSTFSPSFLTMPPQTFLSTAFAAA